MAFKNLLRSEPGERIDNPDFRHNAIRSPIDFLSQLGDEFLLGHDSSGRGKVLWGFDISTASGPTRITVTRGGAIAANRLDGKVRYGLLLSGGADSLTLDLSSFTIANNYGAYIRLDFRETEVQSRRFWDAVTSPHTEVVRAVATRLAEDWTLKIEAASPGDEWLQIATFDLTGGGITNFVDRREFYFEGRMPALLLTNSDWGTTADREDVSTTRVAANTGGMVSGLWRSLVAARRQLQDIIGDPVAGSERWFNDPVSGNAGGTTFPATTVSSGPRSLTQLNAEKFDRYGVMELKGSLIPDFALAHDVGNAIQFWNDMNARDFIARSSGNFEYGAPKTFRRIYSAAAFGNVNSPSSFQRNPARVFVAGGESAALDIHLPQGATFVSFSINWCAQAALGGGTFDVAFNRQDSPANAPIAFFTLASNSFAVATVSPNFNSDLIPALVGQFITYTSGESYHLLCYNNSAVVIQINNVAVDFSMIQVTL